MRRIILSCFLFVCIYNVSNAQENFQDIQELAKYFDQYHSNIPKERVYVHTDRSYYSPGDNIWFKGYITLGNFNRLSNHSKLVYVDLIDPDDKLIQSLILPVSKGMLIGDFSLPVSLSTGSYRIRAYTNWMRNFDKKSFFESEIRILSSFLSKGEREHARSGYNSINLSEKPERTNDDDYGIAVNNLLDNSLIIELQIDSSKVNGQEMQLLIQHDGEIFVAFELTADKTTKLFNIPRDAIGDGINEITLLSENMNPLTRRKVFSLLSSRQLNIQLKTDKKRYLTREKVKVNISLANEEKSLAVGFYSVSVTHQEKVPMGYNNHIVSSLFLNPEFPSNKVSHSGVIEDLPGKGVDSLLLQSGRDEVWNGTRNMGIKFPVEKGLQIRGSVRKMNSRPESGAVVTLFEPNSAFILDTISDSEGEFQFNHLLFNDSTRFVVQAITEKGDKNLQILIDTVDSPAIIKNANVLDVESHLDDRDEAYIFNNRERADSLLRSASVKGNIMLNEVKVKSAFNRNKVTHSANLNGPGNANQVIHASALENCVSLENCLQGLLLGVTFREGIAYSSRSSTIPMRIIIDGVYMGEDDLSILNPVDVETIEVLRSTDKLVIYGSIAGGGLLIVTTKRGDRGGGQKPDAPGVVSISPKGFNLARDFVSPNYSIAKKNRETRDIRSTIHWDPNIVTNKKGESFFEFYTSDEPGMYRVIIEGIDADGRTGYGSMEFEVN